MTADSSAASEILGYLIGAADAELMRENQRSDVAFATRSRVGLQPRRVEDCGLRRRVCLALVPCSRRPIPNTWQARNR